MAHRDLSRGLTFDDAAHAYDRYRPRYPAELFDDLGVLASVKPHSRILEVGSGPGVATEQMIARGWSVFAVDPGEQLAALARDKFPVERFSCEVATFDEWDPKGRRFDLVLSATAYHWVAPEVRWTKAAQVLDEGGVIALLTNEVDDRGSFHEFSVATRELRARYGVDEEAEIPLSHLKSITERYGGDIGAMWEALNPRDSAVIAGDLFAAPVVRIYRWSTTYSPEEALGLLGTYSRFLTMDAARRASLFQELRDVLHYKFRGQLTREYATVLALAARR